jgi:hypothetical protein
VARISQQWKDSLTVAITIGVGIVTGFFVDELSKHESFTISLVSLIALAVAQLFLTFFVPSKEATDLETARAGLAACSKELEVYRRKEKIDLEMKNAVAEQTLKLIKEGKVSEAIEWQKATAGLVTGKEQK